MRLLLVHPAIPYTPRSEHVDLEEEFEQNELNSAVYLISMAMQISNFAVNYKVRFPLCEVHIDFWEVKIGTNP
jgi:hypothetical protein